eukprot:4695480-Pleurochrysis_carterae.AAC.5
MHIMSVTLSSSSRYVQLKVSKRTEYFAETSSFAFVAPESPLTQRTCSSSLDLSRRPSKSYPASVCCACCVVFAAQRSDAVSHAAGDASGSWTLATVLFDVRAATMTVFEANPRERRVVALEKLPA